MIGFSFADVGVNGGGGNATVTVADLWAGTSTQVFGTGYAASVMLHEAVVLRVSV